MATTVHTVFIILIEKRQGDFDQAEPSIWDINTKNENTKPRL
jgi:hypothetical protein